MAKRKLATGSTRDTDWQLREYERLMGKDAAERQEQAAKIDRGDCTCRRRTLRSRGGYRTVHERGCVKFKPWMEEYLEKPNPNADAHVRSMQ